MGFLTLFAATAYAGPVIAEPIVARQGNCTMGSCKRDGSMVSVGLVSLQGERLSD